MIQTMQDLKIEPSEIKCVHVSESSTDTNYKLYHTSNCKWSMHSININYVTKIIT